MNVLQAMLMGLVQGLSEFLPISSSGHLVLTRTLLSLPDTDPLVFEVVVHLGTLVAVLIVFRKDVWNMLTSPVIKLVLYIAMAALPALAALFIFDGMLIPAIVLAVALVAVFFVFRDDIIDRVTDPQSRTVLFLVVATIPAVVVTLLFEDFIEETFGGAYLGIGFIITALFLIFSEVFKPQNPRKFKDMQMKDATIMGVMQGIALFPGISRSGSTISGGLVSGLTRTIATRFAFLMSIPAILGSLVFKFKDLLEGFESIGVAQLASGAIVAAVSGYLAIKLMLHVVRKHKLYGFAAYVAVLGLLILLDQYVFHIFFQTPPF